MGSWFSEISNSIEPYNYWHTESKKWALVFVINDYFKCTIQLLNSKGQFHYIVFQYTFCRHDLSNAVYKLDTIKVSYKETFKKLPLMSYSWSAASTSMHKVQVQARLCDCAPVSLF